MTTCSSSKRMPEALRHGLATCALGCALLSGVAAQTGTIATVQVDVRLVDKRHIQRLGATDAEDSSDHHGSFSVLVCVTELAL